MFIFSCHHTTLTFDISCITVCSCSSNDDSMPNFTTWFFSNAIPSLSFAFKSSIWRSFRCSETICLCITTNGSIVGVGGAIACFFETLLADASVGGGLDPGGRLRKWGGTYADSLSNEAAVGTETLLNEYWTSLKSDCDGHGRHCTWKSSLNVWRHKISPFQLQNVKRLSTRRRGLNVAVKIDNPSGEKSQNVAESSLNCERRVNLFRSQISYKRICSHPPHKHTNDGTGQISKASKKNKSALRAESD